MKSFCILLTALSFITQLSFGQNENGASIVIKGEVKKTLKLTLADVEKYRQIELKAKDKEGKEHTYKGAPLYLLLDSAGVTLGKQLHGEALMKYVLLTASDNYKVVYALAEIDPEFTSNTVLLATQVDGKPLPKGEGPFRIVNPADKRPARWIREVTSITILYSKE